MKKMKADNSWGIAIPIWMGAISIFLIGCLSSIQADQSSKEDAVEQAREILNNENYQTVLSETAERKERSMSSSETEQSTDPEPEGRSSQTVSPTGEGVRAMGYFLEIFTYVFLVVIGILLLVLCIRAMTRYNWFEDEVEEEGQSKEGGEEQEVIMEETRMKSVLKEADQLAEEGEYTTAIRRMFLDVVDVLEKEQDLTLNYSDTNREYLEQIPATSSFHDMVQEVIEGVQRFYYGNRSCTVQDYRKCRTSWKKVIDSSDS